MSFICQTPKRFLHLKSINAFVLSINAAADRLLFVDSFGQRPLASTPVDNLLGEREEVYAICGTQLKLRL